MKHLTLALALLASIGLAQAASHEHEMKHDMQEMHAAMPQGSGVVKAIKPGKVQIAHEPIPALEWPQMTMWFRLDGPLPQGIKAGDKVRFEMKQGTDKQWGIVKLEKD